MIASTSRPRRLGGGVGLLGLLALAGCGGPKLEFAEVEGIVTLAAKPLCGVTVRFYPLSDGKEQLPYATGMTDATGTYRLTCEGGKAGALVGPNRVIVHWSSRDLREAASGNGPPPPPIPPIPVRFTVVSDSPFTLEVRPGGRQIIDLDLEP